MEAYRAAFKTVNPGMTQAESRENIAFAFKALGAVGHGGGSFGSASGNPHGSTIEYPLED